MSPVFDDLARQRSPAAMDRGRTSMNSFGAWKGSGSVPAARRNRTGGKVTTCHPSGPIWTAHREVEIDVVVVFGDPDMNRALRGVELSARLEQIDRRPDCLNTRGVAGPLIISTSQPLPKLPAVNGPGFTMAIVLDMGEGGAVGVVK